MSTAQNSRLGSRCQLELMGCRRYSARWLQHLEIRGRDSLDYTANTVGLYLCGKASTLALPT